MNTKNIANTYGSPEYFLRNGKEMESFQKWIETYSKIQILGESVQHECHILKQTVQKVDPDNNEDKRYSFEMVLMRSRMKQGEIEKLPADTLTFTVVWKGAQDYVSFVGIDGNIKPLPTQEEANGELLRQAVAYLEESETDKALAILLPLSEKRDVGALKLLGIMYMLGEYTEKNEQKGFQYMLMAAQNGDGAAQNEVGTYYLEGRGCKNFTIYGKCR